jgi:MYXO-CTERM domain-containing protein
MNAQRFSFKLALIPAFFLASVAVARADILPPNDCPGDASAGTRCTTAGPNFDQDGVCVSSECGNRNPYQCFLCDLTDASPVSPEDGGKASDAGPAESDLKSNSSCSVGPGGVGYAGGSGLFGLAAAVGLGLVVIGRRRRG